MKLIDCIANDDLVGVKQCLAVGADPNEFSDEDDGYSALQVLMQTFQSGENFKLHKAMLTVLFEKNANPFLNNEDGENAISVLFNENSDLDISDRLSLLECLVEQLKKLKVLKKNANEIKKTISQAQQLDVLQIRKACHCFSLLLRSSSKMNVSQKPQTGFKINPDSSDFGFRDHTKGKKEARKMHGMRNVMGITPFDITVMWHGENKLDEMDEEQLCKELEMATSDTAKQTVNRTIGGTTRKLVHYAADKGHAKFLVMLAARGADMTVVDKTDQGRTILHKLASQDCPGFLRQLFEIKNTNVNIIINQLDDNGKAPLDYAKIPNVFKVLRSHGARKGKDIGNRLDDDFVYK